MGNCLFVEEKPIRIMKSDGKILEYKSPTRVFQVLSDFSGGHAIADAVPVTHHLHHSAKLLSGHLYFLIPTDSAPEAEEKPKKAVRFAVPEKETGEGEISGGRAIRIKVVMTKKELEEMIENGGIWGDEMMSKIKSSGEISCRDELEKEELQRWKPALESIPETEIDCNT
ncbi:uncharacterized protein LOC111005826 [Momordica charantia]|uniref:Uncharacterized protein LOC111005826 n=1 Tax=Momordica charantia TaxID=3673 RepID=A0A6J1BU81_MOMCH|nr:uncharacterized protein LOC111005826 [Momordica charantia]